MKYLNSLILESKQVGMIYHFTGIWNLYEMLNSSDFKIKSDNNYISFTRNPTLFTPEMRLSKLQTRIMINGSKLSSKYKIIPFKDFRGVDRKHGEWEEKIDKVDDLFMLNPITKIDISDCIVEIDILEEPIFRGIDDEFYKTAADNFMYEPNNYMFPKNDMEGIIRKHKELLNNISNIIKDKNYNFEVNLVSKFTNPKYQDKWILTKLK